MKEFFKFRLIFEFETMKDPEVTKKAILDTDAEFKNTFIQAFCTLNWINQQKNNPQSAVLLEDISKIPQTLETIMSSPKLNKKEWETQKLL